MNKSGNKRKNNNKKNSNKKFNRFDHNRDLIGFILIGYAIIATFSIFSDKMGIFGRFINSITFNLMGLGGFLFPIFVLVIGLFLLMDRFNNSYVRNIISLSIIFLSILVLLDRGNLNERTFINHISSAIELSTARSGPGILGAFFGYFFYRFFGTIGTYIVLLFVVAINVMFLTGTRIKDIIEFIKNYRLKLLDKIREMKNTRELKEKDIVINTNNNISINDYNQELDTSELPRNEEETKLPKISEKVKTKADKASKEKSIIEDINENNIKIHNYLYKIPPLNLLASPSLKSGGNDKKDILNNAKKIEDTINNFGIGANVTNINKGPTVTCYELLPDPGIKLSRIVSLSDNLALSLATSDIRIEAPIPGKAAVGIEVPNKIKENVYLKEIINSKEYREIDSDLPLALGKDISGRPIVSSVEKMPHLLIAGATGSGKSVCINTIIMSLIYKSSPRDVKLLLIDPKVVELNVYNGIPHLLIPVVTEAKKSASALNWAVQEMERRYKVFAKNNVRDISAYNHKYRDKLDEKMPKIVIIIDELADLMMAAAHEVEDYITRLAQMARAAGMHLIVATQRPSVDVITGTIKANIPSRISFSVSSQVDSRTILDMSGAEKLLGKGDMLFYPSFYNKPARLQGAFISDKEVEDIVDYLKSQDLTEYDEDIIETVEEIKNINTDDSDELLPEAIELVVNEGQASISLLQRRLRVGYARAARLVDEMELRGIVGGYEGSKPRKVLIDKEDLEDLEGENDE